MRKAKGIALLAAILFMLLVTVAWLGRFLYVRHGSDFLNAAGAYLTGAATLLLSLAAILGGSLALIDYRARVVAEKSKWALQLYEKLFEEGQLKEVRRQLDYGDTKEIKELIKADEEGREFSEGQQGKFDRFTDYLNFFELVARLKAIGQLTDEDINATFDYYLRLLTKQRNPEIRQYLTREGFENLGKLLADEYETQS
jgi:hypothetical protein